MARSFHVMVLAGVAAMLWQAGPASLRAQDGASAAVLTGQITSTEEGRMEGVIVSAKKTGSTVTVSVVTDANGRYSFPQTRLEPGSYAIRVRAIGYEVDNPAPVAIAAGTASHLDLKLHKAEDLSAQLTNGEWYMSWPGTDEQKRAIPAARRFNGSCAGFCHSAEPVVRSHYTAEQWPAILRRMSTYASVSSRMRPQFTPHPNAAAGEAGQAMGEEGTVSAPTQQQAEYLSTINLSSSTRWSYPLKTLPRPKGKGTHVIVTEYDLPRPDAMPHDAMVDADGIVWYADFGHHYLGRLDPKTGKVVDFPLPITVQGYPTGSLDLRFDRDGNIWMGQMYQSGVAKFDRKTQKFQTFPVPKEQWGSLGFTHNAMIAVNAYQVDGKVWMNESSIQGVRRVDIKTGKYEDFPDPFKGIADGEPHSIYGVYADSQNNLFMMDIGNRNVAKIDAETGKVTLYPTPTPDSNPRRGHMDAQDRLWFAEFRANKVAMFDTRSHEFKEWALPPAMYPYDAMVDKNGEIWTGGMSDDRVVRVNTRTGETIEYLMPRSTNIRRVEVDNSTTPPTFWVGNNHGASIVKVEPLD